MRSKAVNKPAAQVRKIRASASAENTNFRQGINAAASGYNAMLMPTTPDTAPTIAEASQDDDSYFRLNGRMLRNPAVINLFDGCALSVPCHDPGTAPVGMMIAGTHNTDRKILAIGLAVEEVVGKRRG